jgi:hypothetical protein
MVRGTPDAETLARSKRFEGKGATTFDLPRLEALLHLLHGPRGGEMTVVHLLDSRSHIELSRIPATIAPSLVSPQCQQEQPLMMVSG